MSGTRRAHGEWEAIHRLIRNTLPRISCFYRRTIGGYPRLDEVGANGTADFILRVTNNRYIPEIERQYASGNWSGKLIP